VEACSWQVAFVRILCRKFAFVVSFRLRFVPEEFGVIVKTEYSPHFRIHHSIVGSRVIYSKAQSIAPFAILSLKTSETSIYYPNRKYIQEEFRSL
jgi:hypothetical protein